jgi:diguanylate cyclase (GGDEF)-like protein
VKNTEELEEIVASSDQRAPVAAEPSVPPPGWEDGPRDDPGDWGDFDPHRNRRAVWIAVSLGVLSVAWAILIVPGASPRAVEEIIWPDLIGESSIALLAAVWLLVVNRLRTSTKAFGFFAVGAVVLFVAALQGMLDEILIFSQRYPSIMENLGKVGGLLCVTVGVVIASRHRRRVEEALRVDSMRYRALSITDRLSKLFNHAYFLEELQAQIREAHEADEPLSLVMLDIDDFKRHNDLYGHLQGDKVISSLGIAIRSKIRGTDIACRYGGEEFTVILPDTGIDDALMVAERIRKACAALPFETEPGQAVNATVSIGVAELAPDEQSGELLRRADMAMFEAKRQGKNRVHRAS